MRSIPPAGITLPQFTAVFVPFCALLAFALVWPELTQALELNRTKATIWAASILLMPALILYPFSSAGQRIANLAHLYWTFAYLIFLVHAYFAVFVIFDGIADTFKQMKPLIAGTNFLLVAWWGLDVLLVWLLRRESRPLAVFQLITRVFVFVVFAATLLFLRGGPVRSLGIVFTALVIVSLAVRWLARDRGGAPVRAA